MTFEPKKKLRIIVLVHQDLVPPDSLDGLTDKEKIEIKTEFDVTSTLKKMGHEVYPIGLYNQLNVIGDALMQYKPHVAFNLLEEFHGYPLYDQHVVSYLELMKQAYTGCNPRGLTLAHDKALTKMILAYHRLQVPNFAVFPMNRKVRRPKRLTFPLLVKSISEEGSVGISQASVVHDDEKLKQRVEFIHRQNKTAAIAEQYIKGREIYVGVIGNQNIQTYAPWELVMEKLPKAPRISRHLRLNGTRLIRKRLALLPARLSSRRNNTKRWSAFRSAFTGTCFSAAMRAWITGLTDDGQFYLLEANPNPQIAENEDFADSAAHSGLPYDQLLQKIMSVGLNYYASNQGE